MQPSASLALPGTPSLLGRTDRTIWLPGFRSEAEELRELRKRPSSKTAASDALRALLLPGKRLLHHFLERNPLKVDTSVVDIHDLRISLNSDRPPSTPQLITVRGTFFPCLLLCSGWWERSKELPRPKRVWKDHPLQEWLFVGFEQWAPSWDISFSIAAHGDQQIIGQLGTGDEADSIMVIASGEHASNLREDLLENLVFQAEVTGILSRPTDKELAGFHSLGESFKYCLRVKDPEPEHRILKLGRRYQPSVYSGYLWQCLAPKSSMPEGRPPPLEETFFVWEHTNFLNADTLAYNKESLQRKVAYIDSRYGPLQLLQKSSSLVDFGGEPKWEAKAFYDWMSPPSL